MMQALLFGLQGPQLFNHSEGPMLGAMLPPLVLQKNPTVVSAEDRCQTTFKGIKMNSGECKH